MGSPEVPTEEKGEAILKKLGLRCLLPKTRKFVKDGESHIHFDILNVELAWRALRSLADVVNPVAQEPYRILDLGCGTGLLAFMAVKTLFPPSAPQNFSITLADIQKDCLTAAKSYAEQLKLSSSCRFFQGSMFDSLPVSSKHSFDLIIFNPPQTEGPPGFGDQHPAKDGGPGGIKLFFQNFVSLLCYFALHQVLSFLLNLLLTLRSG